MDKKDQNLLRKLIGSIDTSPVDKIASAFVDIGDNDLRAQDPQEFHRVDDREAELYSFFFKKGISGKLGNTAIELPASNDNVLAGIMESGFSGESLKNAYDIVCDNYISDDNYSIFICLGRLDMRMLPKKKGKKDESTMSEAGTIYDFVLLLVQPCTQDNPGIIYDHKGNVFKDRISQTDLKAPACAFLYPSFSDMQPDTGHAMCFAKTGRTAGDMKDIAQAIFGTESVSTPEEQEEGFQAIIDSAFPHRMPYEPMQNLLGYFDDLQADAESLGSESILSAKELSDAVTKYGKLDGDEAEQVRETAAEFNNVKFSVSNLAPKNITIDSDYAVIKTDLHDIGEIRKQVIDGQEYIMIPARNVSVQSVRVK